MVARRIRIGAAGSDAAETTSFLARTSGLDATHTNAYKTLINGLVSDGIFAKLDILYIFATQDSTTALLNLCSSSFNGTGVGGLTFTADQGFTGDGASKHITTGFTPSTAGGNYTQNSAAIGAYDRTSRTTLESGFALGCGTGAPDAATTTHIGPRYNRGAGGVWQAVNGGESVIADANAQGNYVLSRTGASTVNLYKNESLLSSPGTTSDGLPTTGMIVFAYNNGGVVGNWITDQLASAFVGGGLTGTESNTLASRINAFMTTVGANVY